MRVYNAKPGDVVQIKSDEWYVFTLDTERNDGTGYWRLMTVQEMIALTD